MVNDYYFNVEYQRFIAGLAGSAPDDAITEVLATALSDTRLGLTQIRQLAQRFAIDVGEEPAPATVGLAAYLQAQLTRGYGLVRHRAVRVPSRSTSTPGPRSGRRPTGPRRTGR